LATKTEYVAQEDGSGRSENVCHLSRAPLYEFGSTRWWSKRMWEMNWTSNPKFNHVLYIWPHSLNGPIELGHPWSNLFKIL